MKVKICGITTLDDALCACDAGADALGFVFYEKSSRYIAPHKAEEIIKKLPPFIKIVGLFVNANSTSINKICTDTAIDVAQIHFEANESFYEQLTVRHLKVVRAVKQSDVGLYENEYKLVDSFVESYGGAGKRINLEWFDNKDRSKIILAGGLNGKNIYEATRLGFYGVDVSSGVESAPGKKDKQKIVEFIREAKRDM